MPKGGHKSGLFPIDGLLTGPFSRHKKRGLYFLDRQDLFTPRWGLRKLRENPSPLPDGSHKSFDENANAAWPPPAGGRHHRFYSKNEARYLTPAYRAADSKHREYLLNQLEPSDNGRRSFSGIGRPDIGPMHSHLHLDLVRSHGGKTVRLSRKGTTHGVGAFGGGEGEDSDDEPAEEDATAWSNDEKMQQEQYDEIQHYRSRHIEAIMRNEDPEVYKMLRNTTLQRGRISRLFDLIVECDIYRGGNLRSNSLRTPPPFVDEKANLVRVLALAECTYNRTNHRINSRRHPVWSQKLFDYRQRQGKHKMRLRILKEEASKRLLRQAFNLQDDAPT
eukprot:GHVS01023232.1.p1 GENE.GHVS01023232.1~~GHVS01023232.1.p1  ORF type:complete len:333 (-),score=52.77 GHVS01023232.1:126-1124(-)